MQKAIDIILGSEILTQQDLDSLVGLGGELAHTFNTVQIFRTVTEMEISVLNDTKFPTPDAKYWQATREQNAMLENLVTLSYQFRTKQIDVKMLERQLAQETDVLLQEKIKIELEQKTFELKCHEREAKDRIREIKLWHDIKEKLKPEMKYGIEDCNKHQLVSYTQRWINQAQYLDGATFGERANLLSQLHSGVKAVKENNILDQLSGDTKLLN